MSEKRQTRAELEARIAQLELSEASYSEALNRSRSELRTLEASAKEMRGQLDSVKERLALAEAENQRMRGYIQRVQEDDVVREDLVKVGDPDGRHQFVPKRKPTHFGSPDPYPTDGCKSIGTNAVMDRLARDRAPPKHWVTY